MYTVGFLTTGPKSRSNKERGGVQVPRDEQVLLVSVWEENFFMLSLQFKACFGKEPSVSNCWWHNFLPVSSCDYFLRSRLSLKYASWVATFRVFPIRHYVYRSFSAVPLNESWFKSIILSGGEILFLVSAWKVRGYSIRILIKRYCGQ